MLFLLFYTLWSFPFLDALSGETHYNCNVFMILKLNAHLWFSFLMFIHSSPEKKWSDKHRTGLAPIAIDNTRSYIATPWQLYCRSFNWSTFPSVQECSEIQEILRYPVCFGFFFWMAEHNLLLYQVSQKQRLLLWWLASS